MNKGIKKEFQIEEFICVISLVIMVAVSFWQILLRFVFGNPNVWSDELARYLYILIMFVGPAYAVIKDTHIRIDSVRDIYPEKVREHVVLVGNIILLIFCVYVAYVSGQYALSLYMDKQMSLGLNIKMAYPYAAIPIGFILYTIRIIQYDILGFFKKRNSI